MTMIQVAIDLLDFDAAVVLAEQVAPHVDILEIGTPCLKHNGIVLLRELRRRFPGNRILVDLKTMDAGEYEVTPFYAAGADYCTVLGAADDGTIRGAVNGATRFGKQCQVDLINVQDKRARAAEIAALGAHVIGVHTGLDQQAAGQTPFADLVAIRSLGLDLVISVAGGIKRETVARARDAGAGIVVAGAAIYAAADPVRAAIDIAEAARAPRQHAA